MADNDNVPLFPKVSSIYLHSGNINNWNKLKMKPNLSSLDQLCEVITETLQSHIDAADKTELQAATSIHKSHPENLEAMEDGERGDMKITVKVFISKSQSPSIIGEAVDKVLNELGTTFIETLLLAVCRDEEEEEEEESVSVSTVQSFWEAMERLVLESKALSLGICDLGKEHLEALYNWAQVKPCVNQVNLESCCVLPKDLTEYAKAINVQLLTHNDNPAFLTKELLQEKIQSVSTDEDGNDWSPDWVARYSGLLKCRGIIRLKGYLLHATRNKEQISVPMKQ